MFRAVTIRGQVYELDHLNEFTCTFVVPAKDGKPEQRYPARVIFSCHCFTRSIPPGGCPEEERYSDHREVRQFDADRHALSLRLPELIQGLVRRNCYHTGRGNFVVVDLLDEAGSHRKYAVYFDIEKVERAALLIVRVASAYPLLPETPNPSKGKPIRFSVVLFNKMQGRQIRVPP